MKKKLLTILLSVFVMMGIFTTNVFATTSYTQVSDLASVADMPAYDGDIYNDTWTNGSGGYLILAEGTFGLITSPFDSMTTVSIFSYMPIEKIDGVDAYKTTEYGDSIVFTLLLFTSYLINKISKNTINSIFEESCVNFCFLVLGKI